MREPLLIEIGPGELLDRLSILRLKRDHAAPGAMPPILAQIESLEALRRALDPDDAITSMERELDAVNRRLWEIEDAVRICERAQRFDAAFVHLARSVYLENDRRGRLKGAIDEALGEPARDVKVYRRTPG